MNEKFAGINRPIVPLRAGVPQSNYTFKYEGRNSVVLPRSLDFQFAITNQLPFFALEPNLFFNDLLSKLPDSLGIFSTVRGVRPSLFLMPAVQPNRIPIRNIIVVIILAVYSISSTIKHAGCLCRIFRKLRFMRTGV